MNSSPIHIIAEAGTNHNAKLSQGCELIDVAKATGADSVKFQLIYPEKLYLTNLWEDGMLVENEVVAIRREGMLSDDEFCALAQYAKEKEIPFSASIFDSKGIALLNSLDPPYLKIASCDLNNHSLLRSAAKTGRKLILSSGMSDLKDVENSLKVLSEIGHSDIVLLHCVSIYPCPEDKINLEFLETLKNEFGFPIGLSDHTESNVAAVAAVSLGVKWIEKHFTLDRTLPGFDHAYAMEPGALGTYVENIRAAEQALAPVTMKLTEDELLTRKRARRGLYAARDLSIGTRLSYDDVLVVRPEGAMNADEIDIAVGSTLTTQLAKFAAISKDDLA